MYCPTAFGNNYHYYYNITINPDCEKALSYDSAIMIKENITEILTKNMLSIGNSEWIFDQISVRKSEVDTIFIIEISIYGDVRANIKYINDGTNFHLMIAYIDTQEYYTYNGETDSFASTTKFAYYNFINNIYTIYNVICIIGDFWYGYHHEC